MLQRLKNLVAPSQKISPFESFGNLKLARSLGTELLEETPLRRNCIRSIRDRLTALTRAEKDDLVDRIFARLALFVFDLPASEANHHSGRFGLLDHLLEVAEQTAQTLTGPGFKVSPEAVLQHREGPRWAYAGVIAALAHDIGKPLDLDVVAPGTGATWDPRKEPLRLFCERHGIPQTSPELWHFHKGRGMNGHERQIPVLLPMVLTPEVEAYLGPRLHSVLRALSPDENWYVSADLSPTAKQVIKVVRGIDKASSIQDQEASHPEEGNPALVPFAPPPTTGVLPPGHEIAGPLPALLPAERPWKDTPGEQVSLPESIADLAPVPIPRLYPPGCHPFPVPPLSKRRGDPVETARKMAHELGPIRFLDTLRRMIVGMRLDRNGLYSPVYLTPRYFWLVVPEAFKAIARFVAIPFDDDSVSRMSDALGSSAWVLPASAEHLTEFIKARPDVPGLKAIRFRLPGFLGDKDTAVLGFHKFEIKVWSSQSEWESPL
jgi:hypothetical protein